MLACRGSKTTEKFPNGADVPNPVADEQQPEHGHPAPPQVQPLASMELIAAALCPLVRGTHLPESKVRNPFCLCL